MQFHPEEHVLEATEEMTAKTAHEKVIRRGNEKTVGDATVKTILAISHPNLLKNLGK